MKFTWHDIVWAGIAALIVVFLSKCHRDKTDEIAGNLIKQAKANDSIYQKERIKADTKLAILLGQMQNAAAQQQQSDKQLSRSMTTIARLSAAVKAAKLLPEDTTFTMVSPEFINYCDSLAINGEKVYDEYDDYKKKTAYVILAKDTAIRLQGNMLKQEHKAYEGLLNDYGSLLQRFKRVEVPRNQVYIGAELVGTPVYLISNVGVVLSLKTKSSKLWQFSGGLQTNGGYYARINGNILLSFKR